MNKSVWTSMTIFIVFLILIALVNGTFDLEHKQADTYNQVV